ncbi:MAG: GNAT family N-acetyltransferase [Bacteroidia bacterium]|nr:GNAT family N-acetyltransferase [Bacteroidia bacterium]
MKKIKTRKITFDDIDQLQAIGIRTFTESFAAYNTVENMNTYLAEGFSKETLTTGLTNKNSAFYFAELDNEIIGYLKINVGDAQTENQDHNALEIERIYVLKKFHGKKVGQMLYEQAIKIARQKKVDYVWLGVWEKNPRALRFYQKNGFVAFDQHVFPMGDDPQIDIMMKLELNTISEQ